MKTSIKRIDSLTHNDTTATKNINDNFAALQASVEDTLSRTGKTPNFMDAELDMNTRRIINVGDAVDDTDAANWGQMRKAVEKAEAAADRADKSAHKAAVSEVNARQYASEARDSRDRAEQARVETEEIAEKAKKDIGDLVDNGVELLDGIVSEGKKELDEGIREIEELIESGEGKIKNATDEGVRKIEETADGYQTADNMVGEILEGVASDKYPSAQAVIDYVAKHGGSGTGGTRVFAANGAGKNLVEGDKVLLNLFENTKEIVTEPYRNSISDSTIPIYVLENKDVWFNSYSGEMSKNTVKGDEVITTKFKSSLEDKRYPGINWGGLVTFKAVSNYTAYTYDYSSNALQVATGEYIKLSDEYIFYTATGMLENSSGQQYNTGIGVLRETQKQVQLFGDILVAYISDSTIKHIDLTNFPNCEEKTYILPYFPPLVFGFTGADVGSYFIANANADTVNIHKFTGSEYAIEKVLNILTDSCIYTDLKNKVISYFDENGYPKVLTYDKGSDRFVEKEIPSDIREKILEYAALNTRGNSKLYIATNSSMSAYGISYGVGQYDGKFVAIYPTDYNTYVLKESDSKYYNNDTSYTAYVTGNTDSNGRYEVETLLPDIVNVTLAVNPDVTDDEFKVIKVDIQ